MAEWLKAHAWKACVRETVPWVRIPLSPPRKYIKPLIFEYFFWVFARLVPKMIPTPALSVLLPVNGPKILQSLW